MESYRLTSKLRQKDHEYFIQTSNDMTRGSILTTLFVDGVQAETVTSQHPVDFESEEILSFVKATHAEKRDEVEKLLQIFKKVIREADPKAIQHLGNAFFCKGLYHEARELFRTATVLDKKNHQAFNMLGMVELALNNPQQALAAAENAIKAHPEYADYRNNYAEALFASGDVKQAIIEFDRAIESNLYYSDAYFNLGLARLVQLINQTQPTDSEDEIKTIGDLFHRASLTCADFRDETLLNGMEALRNRDLTSALSAFQTARDRRKEAYRQESAPLHMKHVLHPDWVSERAISERIEVLERELTRNPSYADLYAELAQCHFERARLVWSEGIEQLGKTVKICPSPDLFSSPLAHANQVHCQMRVSLKLLTERG